MKEIPIVSHNKKAYGVSRCGKIPIIENNKRMLKKALQPPGW